MAHHPPKAKCIVRPLPLGLSRLLTSQRAGASNGPRVFVVVSKTEQEELRQKRAQQHKKRAKAIGSAPVEIPRFSEPSKPSKPSVDPLRQHDPWKSLAQPSRPSSSVPPLRPPSLPSHTVAPPPQEDQRIGAMLVRLDNLEKKNTVVEDRLEKLDSSVENMGLSMTQQFAAVMKGISDLTAMQKANNEPEHKQKRAAVQPFGS